MAANFTAIIYNQLGNERRKFEIIIHACVTCIIK